ncbi:QWRF domain containing 2 [Hibiscus trionum]|uniref:QWRF domain containing 2 n=1 Tax=Hibiscus trionum TaxID=183268 RepID=A0A9W7LTX6_HIBTR|nr:QWRF domain containing 2 [Hibiscus trionum]
MVLVAAVSATVNSKRNGGSQPRQNPSRPLLIPSDSDNAMPPRRLKFREVTSRYLSTSSSSNSSTSSTSSSEASTKRCPSPSPSVSRSSSHSATITTPKHATSLAVKRSQSVGRRPAVTPRPYNSTDLNGNNCNNKNGSELSTAQKLLFTSTRSLSVSFQGESFSYQFSKAKPSPSPSPARKGTPERRKPMAATNPVTGTDQMENSKTERWPARIRKPDSMTRSVDCTDERKRLNGSVNNNVVRALQNSMIDNRDLTAVGSEVQSDLADSDTESVSSVCTPGALESSCNGNGDVKLEPRGIIVPTRFWQETAIRLRRSDSGSPVFRKNTAPSKLIAPDKFGIDSPLSSPKGVMNSRQQLSPIRGPVRPASPSKLGASLTSSPLRGTSPSRVRNGLGGSLVNTPSILSFAGDVIKMGKIGENKVSNAHLLRLLHNRFLQWRFVNAKADVVLSSQRSNAEKSLYNAWTSTSKLLESVRAKRTVLQLLTQNLKLISILKGQMIFLDKWAVLDHEYCSSFSGATEALKASTLRLPVVCGARADVLKLKDAICSAVDVMQAMASSICSLSPRVAELNLLAAELGNLSANEFVLLNRCKELLSAIAAMQVTECSMRTHVSQLNCLPSGMTTKL